MMFRGQIGKIERLRSQVLTVDNLARQDVPDWRAALGDAAEALSAGLEEIEVMHEELHDAFDELSRLQVLVDLERRHYADLFELAPDGYLVSDTVGVIKEANQAAARLFNVTQPRLVGKPLAVFLPERDRERLRELLDDAPSQPGPVTWETMVVPRLRMPRRATITVVAGRDSRGRVTTMRWVLRDVTEAKRAADGQRFLAEASAVLGRSFDLDEMLRQVAGLAISVLGDRCVVDLVDDAQRIRRVAAAPSWDEPRWLPVDPRRSDHPVVRVLRTGKAERFNDVVDELRALLLGPLDHRDARLIRRATSLLVVPLVVRGKAIGTLSFLTTQPHREYDAEDLALASELARRVSLATDRIQSYRAEQQARRDAERSRDRINRLLRLTAALSGALSSEQVANVILHQGLTALDALAGFVIRTDEGAEVLVTTGLSPDTVRFLERYVLPLDAPILDLVPSGEPVFLPRPTAATRYPALAERLLQNDDAVVALVPLIVEEKVVGAIGLHFRERPSLDSEDRAFAIALAQQGVQALERARLYDAERRARAEAEASRRRLASLAEASQVLASSLDDERTIEQVVRLAVRMLGDLCIVDVISGNGHRRITVGFKDPADHSVLQMRRLPDAAMWDGPFAVASVLRTGRPEVLTHLLPFSPDTDAPAPEYRDLFRQLAPRSAVILPLRIQERILGTITMGVYHAGQAYRAADLTFAEELARRFAFAIDNARLYREGQEAIRLRDTVLFSVSHDLRSPLAAIRFIGGGLIHDIEKARPVRRNYLIEGLRHIDTNAQRISDEISGLLDAARLQSGQVLRLNRVPTDLVALTQRLAIEYQARTHRHQIRIESEVHQLVGSWDPGRLERVLSNLLSNAIKYSPQGGDVDLRIWSERAEGRSWAILQVRDHGMGIPAADLPRMFTWFFRGDNVAERVPGSGIGLAGAAEIIAQHGGTIDVESQEGVGSAFAVRLPLDSVDSANDVMGSPEQPLPPRVSHDLVPVASKAKKVG